MTVYEVTLYPTKLATGETVVRFKLEKQRSFTVSQKPVTLVVKIEAASPSDKKRVVYYTSFTFERQPTKQELEAKLREFEKKVLRPKGLVLVNYAVVEEQTLHKHLLERGGRIFIVPVIVRVREKVEEYPWPERGIVKVERQTRVIPYHEPRVVKGFLPLEPDLLAKLLLKILGAALSNIESLELRVDPAHFEIKLVFKGPEQIFSELKHYRGEEFGRLVEILRKVEVPPFLIEQIVSNPTAFYKISHILYEVAKRLGVKSPRVATELAKSFLTRLELGAAEINNKELATKCLQALTFLEEAGAEKEYVRYAKRIIERILKELERKEKVAAA